jgi:ribosome maturation factor RimP
MDRGLVKSLIDEAVADNSELFLIDFKISSDNKIYVEVDGDQGVTLKECIRISRGIEHNLDRENEDFSLEVTTPDVSNPLKVKRQYNKNLNRILTLRLVDGSGLEGRLIKVGSNEIDLEWKAREPKPIGKGKITVVKRATVAFEDILEAKVKIIF